MVDLADTTLVLSNSAQWRSAQENQYPTWFQGRGYKDVDDFIERRRPFFDKDARWNSRDGKPTQLTWSLVPRGDTGTANILAGCETYLRPGIYLPPGGTEPVECVSYGISCVYTNPTHRKNGYARHMFRLLHYIMAPPSALPPFPSAWGAPPTIPPGIGQDAAFSVLYSGVGDKFYANCTKGESEPGWAWDAVPVRQWDIPSSEAAAETEGKGWTWLRREDLREWEVEAARRIRRELSTTGDESKTRLAILPDPGCFEVHAVRYQVIGGARPEATFGIVLPPNDDGQRPFFTYSSMEKKDVPAMVIMFATKGVPWTAVAAAARREGMSRVEMWGEDKFGWDKEAGSVKLLEGEASSCSAIAQYQWADDKIEWEWNEKYAWM